VAKSGQNSRQAVLQAAAAEFAARGFAGAGVDRIARRAGVNKAMIYYHFKDKAHLYRDIVCDMFTAIRARTGAVASSDAAPAAKLDAFIEAIVAEARARPHFPPMMMREAAEGGRHLDQEVFRLILGIFGNMRAILEAGAVARAFRRVDPVLMYFTLVGPIVMYLSIAPIRHAIGRVKAPGVPRSEIADLRRHLTALDDVDALREHLKRTARLALERGGRRAAARPARKPAPRGRRRAAQSPGEQA
jgi:AcrR family transcriptional regulator